MSDETQKTDAEIFDELAAASNETPEVVTPPTEPAPEAGSSVVEAENPPDEFDPEALPPAAKARFEQIQRDLERERSDKRAAINRLAPTQRELAELRKQSAQVVAAPVTPAPQATTPAESDYDAPEWKLYEKNFPDEAKAIRKVNEAQAARLAKAEARFAELTSKTEQKFGTVDAFVQEQTKNRELAALEEAHPDYHDIVFATSAEHAVAVRRPDGQVTYFNREFHDWMAEQPVYKQKLFASNDAADNIDLLNDYKRDAYLASLHMQTEQAPPDPKAEAAQRAHQRREQARSTSVAPDLRGQAAVARMGTQGMSDADIFDQLVAQQNKR